MHLRLLAVGERMPGWVAEGLTDYSRRLPREWRFALVELPAGRASGPKRREDEGERLLRAVGEDRLIALDEHGSLLDSVGWSQSIAGWQQDGRNVTLAIGGADGHAQAVLARAEARWSLSRLTLPHALVRVVVAEQLYRAHTLLSGHPYHRS
jgi:23S rRNA (pseudouridine-1915-N(3)-) methyltransferase